MRTSHECNKAPKILVLEATTSAANKTPDLILTAKKC